MKVERFRDLTIIDINDRQALVISCDSAGGIGSKENDIVKASPELVGYYTSLVALMENLAFGARPISIVNTLAVEMDPSGKKIIKGIKKSLEALDFDIDLGLTGTTEENIPVSLTGLGITIIGIIDKKSWERPKSKEGDLVVSIGLPKVGDEVVEDQGENIMDIPRLLKLLDLGFIHEILPVGSKGIEYEISEMARTNKLSYELLGEIGVDIKTSAGPATCVIASISEEDFTKLEEGIDIKVNKLGYFKRMVI